MDLKYLEEVIIPQRKQEIEEEKNSGTRQPIYVVMDLQENYISGHIEFDRSGVPNNHHSDAQIGYVDDYNPNCEDREIKNTKIGMTEPSEITMFHTDVIVAFFLTRKGAEDYLKYQSHNLNDAYIYTFYSGYGNREMDLLLKGE